MADRNDCAECGKNCTPGEYHTYLHCLVYMVETQGWTLTPAQMTSLVEYAKQSTTWKGRP